MGTVSSCRVLPSSRICTDHCAHSVLATLSTQRNALSMLQSRVSLIVQYLRACLAGKARKDSETLRMIASLVGSLPGGAEVEGAEEAKEGGELKEEFLTVRLPCSLSVVDIARAMLTS